MEERVMKVFLVFEQFGIDPNEGLSCVFDSYDAARSYIERDKEINVRAGLYEFRVFDRGAKLRAYRICGVQVYSVENMPLTAEERLEEVNRITDAQDFVRETHFNPAPYSEELEKDNAMRGELEKEVMQKTLEELKGSTDV